jgi:hypothetical protein
VSIDTSDIQGLDGGEEFGVDLLGDTIDRLRELEASLTQEEQRLAAQLADVRQKKTGAQRALGIFTGATPRKRRGRPRKQQTD